MTIQEMKIGDHASVTKTVSETDVYLFAGITGDLNPAHTNEVAASKTMFKTRIAHGMLGAGFISAVLGMYLPGPGTIYMGQELRFVKPVHIGDTVTATATVVERNEELKFTKPVHIGDTVTATATVEEIILEKNRVILDTTVVNQDGEVVIKGKATVMPPKA